MTVKMIDPPSGWRYGFPKALPDPEPVNLTEWLVENGYPQEEIDSLGEYFFCRHWEE
jgi:microsomal dipeptidase-like Zn-dependent dipeptidase